MFGNKDGTNYRNPTAREINAITDFYGNHFKNITLMYTIMPTVLIMLVIGRVAIKIPHIGVNSAVFLLHSFIPYVFLLLLCFIISRPDKKRHQCIQNGNYEVLDVEFVKLEMRFRHRKTIPLLIFKHFNSDNSEISFSQQHTAVIPFNRYREWKEYNSDFNKPRALIIKFKNSSQLWGFLY